MRALALGTGLLIALVGCGREPARDGPPPEPWTDRPVEEWPDLVLTNTIEFRDTTLRGLANAFLVDTGRDTVGVTAKHLFLVLARTFGLEAIDPGDALVQWRFPSSRDPTRVVAARRLVNRNPEEPIGDFSSLKDRDWLVFELERPIPDVHPLKLRLRPIGADETVYAVGRSAERREEPDPSVTPLRRFRAVGGYYYVRARPDADPAGTSGSPVIDANGHLVGIVSGAVGELGVVSGVRYLAGLLEGAPGPRR